MLSCLLFYGLDGLAELRDVWELMSAASPGRFFSEWAYWDALLHTFERDPQRFVFALVKDASPLAIIPLRAERQNMRGLPVRALKLARYFHPSLTAVACRGDADPAVIYAALLKGLRAERWDLLELDFMIGDSILATAPRNALVEVQTTCDRIRGDLPWDTFAAQLSAKFRTNLNQSRSRLAKMPGTAYGFSSDPAELPTLFEHLTQLEDAGWKGTTGTSILKEPHSLEFYRRIIELYGKQGRVCINWLKVGDRYIAMQFCRLEGDTLYVLKIAYDETLPKVSPGNALLAEVVRSQRHGWINLVGSPTWFTSWNPESMPVVRVRLINSTPLGLLASAGIRAVRIARPFTRKRQHAA